MKKHGLYFSVDDNLLGEQVSPENMSLPLLAEFTEQVASFLRGSNKVDLKEVRTSIRKGSLALAIDEPTPALEGAAKDYERMTRTKSIEGIDPVRARVVSEWQATAKRNPDRVYQLLMEAFGVENAEPFVISVDTEYVVHQDTWVNVEEYVYGKIYDLGGKNQPNVHLLLSNGRSVKVQADIDLLAEDRINRLYRKQLVHIKAERNLTTKELRNETLISFEKYNPHFDEDEFQEIVTQGRAAWKGIKSATQWVEELRGNYA